VTGQLERLAAAGIQLLPLTELPSHYVLMRDGFAALVERRETGFGAAGAAGLLTEEGLAPLVWRSGKPWFINKTIEREATVAEVQALRRFADSLEAALRGR
jgi:hypothetical protein